MSTAARVPWQSVEREVLRRIHARVWPPGALLPTEAELAAEFGCARTTVNRALREIAETGLLDRRRKAGTRVALHPVARATFDIPVMRREVEALGHVYDHRLLERFEGPPPPTLATRMDVNPDRAMLCLKALHQADGAPFATEVRWINLGEVPDARDEPFDDISANEWLLRHAPYTHGQITFSATRATPDEASTFAAAPGAAVFVIDRMTWNEDRPVTQVRIAFPEDYTVTTTL